MAERVPRERYYSETGAGSPSQMSWRGNRGTRSNRPRHTSENQSPYLHNVQEIEKDRDPCVLFEFINNTEDEFDNIIDNETLSSAEMRTLVYILTHSHFDYETPETGSDINTIYSKIIDSKFITSGQNLKRLISITFKDLTKDNLGYEEKVRCTGLLLRIMTLVRTLLNKFRTEYEHLSECIAFMNYSIESGDFNDYFGPNDIESFKDLYTQLTKVVKPKVPEKKDAEKIKQKSQPILIDIDSNNYGDPFRNIPVFPTYHEIRNPSNVELRALVKKGEYEDQETYLDIHFKLLREDMVYPLKVAVKNLLELDKNYQVQLYTYDKVRVNKITANHTHGLIYLISFEPYGIKNRNEYDWNRSTRLKFGSLLCISQKNKGGYPNFENPLWAVVTHSDEKEIKETGLISIKFKNGFEPNFKFDTDYFMIESREVYFEAYCHVLSVIQEIKQTTTLPFQPILLGKVSTCPPPAYIDWETKLDFTAVSSKEPSRALALDTDNWPAPDELNASQYDAVKLAFTSELALIQGPPGTGKTYVGMAIVKIFLRTRKYEIKAAHYDKWLDEAICQRPIFVITHTNHAVDQFLELIMAEDNNVIRIGSRSESELVKTRTLYEVKKNAFNQDIECPDKIRQLRKKFGAVKRQLYKLSEVIEKYSEELKSTKDLSMEDLKRVASEHHYKSMYPTQQKGFTTIMNEHKHMSEVWLKQLGVQCNLHEKLTPNEGEIPTEKNPFSIIASLDLTIPDDKEIADKFKIVETRLEYLDLKGEIEPESVDSDNQDVNNNVNNADDSDSDENLFDAIDSDDEENQHDMEEDPASLFDTSVEEGIASAQLAEEEKDILKEAAEQLKEALANLETETTVSEAVLKETNIWKLNQEDRELLFKYWLERKVHTLGLIIKSYADKYLAKTKELEAISSEVDLHYLKSAAIIGMTTTGAAKNAKLLRKLEPRVIIVEEAAEVLEAHIITSLSDHVEHLIMIGDHEQLRPSNAVYSLAKQYNLNLSLFERLIENKVEHITLNCQHRMRPEISNIMQIIYPVLGDHDVVKNLARIRGVTTNLYFIAHDHLEDELNEDSTTRSNIHEAKFVIQLALYLIKQGYEPSNITLLTFYNGQKYLLKDLLAKEDKKLEKVTIVTVDKYQGEENDIVILSVVRGNERNYIGHCCVDNRVCVAFSRAKEGFFVIGNMKRLRIASKNTKSDRWNKILDRFEKEKCLGTALPLCCERHDKAVTNVVNGEDFAKVRDGGCSLKCEFILPCSHQCPLLCHAGGHDTIICTENCLKNLSCAHRCPGKCFEDCSAFKCTVLIEKQASCGHMIRGACSLADKEFSEIPCTFKCTTILLCGHPCVGNCDVCLKGSHVPCAEKCPKKLICGHDCEYVCHFPSDCPPCAEPCSRCCTHSKCLYLCGDVCIPCTEECISVCEHVSITRKCNELSQQPLCTEKCKVKLQCGHKCVGFCGEICPSVCRTCDPDHEIFQVYFGEETEEDSTFITLPECGHVFEMKGLEEHFQTFIEKAPFSLLCCPRCNVEVSTCVRFHNMTRKIKSAIDKNKVEIAEKTRTAMFSKCDTFSASLTANAFHVRFVELIEKIPNFQNQIRTSNSYKLYILDEVLNILVSICSKEYTPELWIETSPLTQLILSDSLDYFFDEQSPNDPTQDRMHLAVLKQLYRSCPIYAMFELSNKDLFSSKLRRVFNSLKCRFDVSKNSQTQKLLLKECETFLSKIRGKYELPIPISCTLYAEYVKIEEVKSKASEVLKEQVEVTDSITDENKESDPPNSTIIPENVPPQPSDFSAKITFVNAPSVCIGVADDEGEWVDDF